MNGVASALRRLIESMEREGYTAETGARLRDESPGEPCQPYDLLDECRSALAAYEECAQ